MKATAPEDRLRTIIEASAEEARRAPPEPEPEAPSTAPAHTAPAVRTLPWYTSANLAIALWAAVLVVVALDGPSRPSGSGAALPAARTLGIATYHAVHRIETTRARTGTLPAGRTGEWTEAINLDYVPLGELYRLTARAEGLELVYVAGLEPERLLDAPQTLVRVVENEAVAGTPDED